MPFIAIALVIAAALGGGTAYAAQSSLPGDALWNFKTAVNEGVQGLTAQDDVAKANLDLSLASKRLDEAQELAHEGTLNAQARTQLTANFDAHAQNLTKLITKLEAEGKTTEAADIAAHWQAELAKSATDIRTSATTTAEADVAPLLTSLRATLDDAATLSEDASAHAQLRGGNAGTNPNTEATLHTDANARLEGGAGSTTTENGSSDVEVHTGTSIKGGEGGIKATGDGSVVGI